MAIWNKKNHRIFQSVWVSNNKIWTILYLTDEAFWLYKKGEDKVYGKYPTLKKAKTAAQ